MLLEIDGLFCLVDNQNVALDKRMKLDYDEIPCFEDATKLWDANKNWDTLIAMNKQKVEMSQLTQAVTFGKQSIGLR